MAVINFVEELRWRGLLQDSTPGAEEHLMKGPASGYIGFDPTADSLHVGNLVQIMILVHFQRCGHKPVALVGGATGMVGDPSGKKSERNLLDEDALRHNQACVQKQLERFLDFNSGSNAARMVNNYDWFKDMGFLRFIRDVGKHITVNYMMAKDSVKSRLESGLSFTEFSYQLVQGYDYWWLNQHEECTVQMGGSDQWGNITTGTELIRRMGGNEAYAITTPLLTKADGSKFGKSESGNVWLDAERTSPYKFYQFWLNASDTDAAKFAAIFTPWSQSEVKALIADHSKAPHERKLQKVVAGHITRLVHGAEELGGAIQASEGLFSVSTKEEMQGLPKKVWNQIFDETPNTTITLEDLQKGIPVVQFLSGSIGFLPSGSEARRAIKEGSVHISGSSVSDTYVVKEDALVHGQYIPVKRGKRNYFLVKVV